MKIIVCIDNVQSVLCLLLKRNESHLCSALVVRLHNRQSCGSVFRGREIDGKKYIRIKIDR